jgi:GT2 family glycosyltransferase
MDLPAVHIITLNWNGLADTLECLASLRTLSYPNVRVHVVDNGSRSTEAEVIAERFPGVDLTRLPENLGFCRGNNLAIEKALCQEADFILLLNNDTLVEPDLLDALLKESEGLEAVGAVSPIIMEHPERERVWFSRAVWEPARAQFRLSRPEDDYAELRNAPPYTSAFACGCCMLVSAEVVRQIGLLDERYFAFYDEAEWCARMKRRGLRCYVVPSARIYHRVSRSTPGLVSTYLLTRNRLRWMRENLSVFVRAQSMPYLSRELFWHLGNAAGAKLRNRASYSRAHSRALVEGWKDYLLGRGGKWSRTAERVILPR